MIDDPDGIVVEVDFVARPKVAADSRDASLGWSSLSWLISTMGSSDGRLFRYRMTGGQERSERSMRL